MVSLVFAGCGQTATVSNKESVSLEIVKSPTNTQKVELKANSESTNLKELMDQAGISFKTEMHGTTEFVRELSGVIATASKSWKLYINGKINNFTKLSEIKINQLQAIEWRYEENK